MNLLGNYRDFLTGVAWLLVFLILFFIIGATGWLGLAPDRCVDSLHHVDTCYCEAFGSGFIKEPSNTWSNFGFIAVGLSILWWTGWQRATGISYGPSNRMSSLEDTSYTALYGHVVVFMGAGSIYLFFRGEKA